MGAAKKVGKATSGQRGSKATTKVSKGTRRLSKPVAAATFEVPDLSTLELAGRLDRVAKIVSRVMGDVARQHGATTSQLHVVERLARSPGGLTAKQLAAALAIRPGSLTGTLDGLEKRKIVQRQAVRGDARQQRIVLLPGAQALVDLLPKVDAAVAAGLGELGQSGVGDLNSVMRAAEDAVRSQRAVPAPAVLAGEKAENSDAEQPEQAEAAPVTIAETTVSAQDNVAPEPAPTPQPVEETPRWQRQEPAPASEGSLGRGLFRIASRVISAAEGRRRRKD